jgi:hypothetical protein
MVAYATALPRARAFMHKARPSRIWETMPLKAIILGSVAVMVGGFVGLAGYAFTDDVGFGLVAFALVTVIIGVVILK